MAVLETLVCLPFKSLRRLQPENILLNLVAVEALNCVLTSHLPKHFLELVLFQTRDTTTGVVIKCYGFITTFMFNLIKPNDIYICRTAANL